VAKRFDSTTKQLVEAHPADWLALAGLPSGPPAEVVDADLSSFTLAADKLIRVGGSEPYIGHIELQAGADPRLDRRVLMYNSVAADRHELPVRSAVFLLRPEALAPANRGRVQDLVDPACRLEFSYRLIRVWELQVETVLAGGLGTLPLAPIAAVDRPQLPDVYRRVAARLDREAQKTRADELWLATYILSGLRYPTSPARL
jgi:predicted transposase YdaD